MRYAETQTRASSHPMIYEFWRFDAGPLPAPVEHVVPPDGLVSIWALRRIDGGVFCGVTGPSARASRPIVENGMTIVGVRAKPGAPARFFSLPLPAIAGKMVPLAIAAPGVSADFERAAHSAFNGDYAALETLFDRLDVASPAGDDAIESMAQAIIDAHGEGEIRAHSASVGLSPKAARVRFRAVTGLNPKDFSRVRRIRRACMEALKAGAGWSAVSLEAGFADQAHLARECRDIFEMTPRDLRRALTTIRHGAVYSA